MSPIAAPRIIVPPARLLVVVPMKDPAQAKTRLSGTLSRPGAPIWRGRCSR